MTPEEAKKIYRLATETCTCLPCAEARRKAVLELIAEVNRLEAELMLALGASKWEKLEGEPSEEDEEEIP